MMNKFLFSLFLLLAVPLGFVSCSDDEEYVPDSVDLIIQKLQSETYSEVWIYRDSHLVAGGTDAVILDFAKPYMVVDGSNIYSSSTGFTTPEGTKVYLDLNKLADLQTWPDPENPEALCLMMYFY